jgi:hypothetical protein
MSKGIKTVGTFKKDGIVWHVGIDLTHTFNGDPDDKKQLRKAFKEAMKEKGMKDALQYWQGLERK